MIGHVCVVACLLLDLKYAYNICYSVCWLILHMPILITANLQEEILTQAKVTVKQGSRCDENDQCWHAGTCQVVTLFWYYC